MGARPRLALLLGTVVVLLSGLELVARASHEQLSAVAHRVRFKLAMLHAHGPVDFVIVGSSRSNDGLAPNSLNWGQGFSLATPSTSLPTLRFVTTSLTGPKRVLLEVSRPTFASTSVEPEPWTQSTAPTSDPAWEWLLQHSTLLSVRRAFALENWPRLAGLLFAPRFDGSEWLRDGGLRWLVASSAPPAVSDDAAWKPQTPPANSDTPLDDEQQRIIRGYLELIAELRLRNIDVVLLGPPLGGGWRAEECTPWFERVRSEIAAQSGRPFLDFTCREVSEPWFLEGQHLTAAGRQRFSRAVAEALRGLP